MSGYHEIAEELSALISTRVLRSGDRLPSVRRATTSRRVNAGTVVRAYRLLEARGFVESRPRAGYFVSRNIPQRLEEPAPFKTARRSSTVDVSDLIFDVFQELPQRAMVQFASPFVNPELFPLPQLNRAGAAAARALKPAVLVDYLPPGSEELRRLFARRYLDAGCTVGADEIVVTCGALEAITLSLRAVTRPGDTVAIETPTFYAILQSLECMGLKCAEIETDCRLGMNVDALERALNTRSIQACIVNPTFQNPLGSCMPESQRQAMADLAARYRVPVIEDDCYAELHIVGDRPRPIKAFDRGGWVLHCGSMSKCLAPGYRIGWTAPGRFFRQVWKSKIMTTLATPAVCQETVVRYLKRGGFEQHLRRLRSALAIRREEIVRALSEEFPAEARATRPRGGYMIWVELPKNVDALLLYRLARDAKVSILPGAMFSANRRYESCIRLNYGWPSVAQIRRGVHILAQLLPAASRK